LNTVFTQHNEVYTTKPHVHISNRKVECYTSIICVLN